MIRMSWKPKWMITVFLAVAVLYCCTGGGGSEKERSTRTRLTAIPFAAGKIKLNWTDSASDEKGFKIERTANPRDESWTEVATVGADITSYIDDLKDEPIYWRHDNTYYYRVSPFGGAKAEKYSNIEAEQIAPRGMAAIPAGCFEMGDTFGEGAPDEVPVRRVCLPAFYMDVHEVTNAEYAKCVEDGDCHLNICDGDTEYYSKQEYDDYPVIVYSRSVAQDYCTWSGKRVPTEAEWEYAARGGLSGKRYPRGDTISCSDANYGRGGPSAPCLGFGGHENRPQKVGSYAPNGYGLHDMAGNVSEYVNDLYSANYYIGRPEPDIDPPGPGNKDDDDSMGRHYRVVRGGSWASISPLLLRVSYRDIESGLTFREVGFRCAMDQHPIEE